MLRVPGLVVLRHSACSIILLWRGLPMPQLWVHTTVETLPTQKTCGALMPCKPICRADCQPQHSNHTFSIITKAKASQAACARP